MRVLDKLLRYSRRAFTKFARFHVRNKCRRHTLVIYAVMRLKPLVFDGYKRIDGVRRKLVEFYVIFAVIIHYVI